MATREERANKFTRTIDTDNYTVCAYSDTEDKVIKFEFSVVHTDTKSAEKLARAESEKRKLSFVKMLFNNRTIGLYETTLEEFLTIAKCVKTETADTQKAKRTRKSTKKGDNK